MQLESLPPDPTSEDLWRSNLLVHALPRVNLFADQGDFMVFEKEKEVPEDQKVDTIRLARNFNEMHKFELEDELGAALWNQVRSATPQRVRWGDFPPIRLGVTSPGGYNRLWELLPRSSDAQEQGLARAGFTNLLPYGFPIGVDSHAQTEEDIYLFGIGCRTVTPDEHWADDVLKWVGRLELPDLYISRPE